MGLAASQARLLSITSRMSDNELRSQLINNAKMRLTTDSARVSDEYIAALNKTQLMFTNFDPLGNEKYQELTFNALTAYSGYNNQYGIVNNAGELLVSTLDAGNFEKAGGDLEKFLELYGLEKKTSYFETLENSPEFLESGIGYYDMFDNWQTLDASVEEMQAIYEGNELNGVSHYGEDSSLKSIEYGDYQELVEDYQKARDDFRSSIRARMKDFIGAQQYTDANGNKVKTTINGILFEYDNHDFEYYYQQVQAGGGNIKDLTDAFYGFANKLGISGSNGSTLSVPDGGTDFMLGKDKNRELLEVLNQNINSLDIFNNHGGTSTSYEYEAGSPIQAYVLLDSDGNPQTYYTKVSDFTTKYIYDDGISTNNTQIDNYGAGYGDITTILPLGDHTKVLSFDAGLNDMFALYIRPAESGETPDYTDPATGTGYMYTWEGKDDFSGATPFKVPNSESYDGLLVSKTETITQEDADEALRNLYTSFRDGIIDNMKEETFINADALLKAKFDLLKQATENLAKFIWGDATGTSIAGEMFGGSYDSYKFYYYLDDPSWVLSTNGTIDDIDNDRDPDIIPKSHYNPWAGTPTTTAEPDPVETDIGGITRHVSYQATKDLFLLECMLEHYGEPLYTWIDKNNPEENGEAKATWYTNLFNRMLQGYKKLGEGLGNSAEWIQFAFESGLVHMEQVNKSSEWVSTMYTNCSGITESTVDVDITLAEAKYKREMAKIEAKDKRYDIELKNIDTEHESLKQEYESIKKVISTNISRNYKMFQQA